MCKPGTAEACNISCTENDTSKMEIVYECECTQGYKKKGKEMNFKQNVGFYNQEICEVESISSMPVTTAKSGSTRHIYSLANIILLPLCSIALFAKEFLLYPA